MQVIKYTPWGREENIDKLTVFISSQALRVFLLHVGKETNKKKQPPGVNKLWREIHHLLQLGYSFLLSLI